MPYYVMDSDEKLSHREWENSTFAYQRATPHPQGSWSSLQESLAEANEVAQKLAAGAMKTLPHVLKGAATGARFGPYGAIVGAVAGGVKGVKQTNTTSGVTKTVPAQGSTPSAPSPAAAQLLKVLYRPEMLQALVMMLVGNNGPGHVKVGDTPVPAAAFANLLGSLAGQAAAENYRVAPAYSEEIPSYLLNHRGELIGDPTAPEDHAAALFHLLEQTP